MASIQERLQMKREPLDKWSTREQLCLVSAVNRSGDQNWMSVSRALKPFGDPSRPTDWFHQKNCAAQFGALLSNVDTPKRKKRSSGAEMVIETPVEIILKKLLIERQTELKTLLAEEKAEYHKLQEDMILLQSGKVSEEQLDIWNKEIDEEEQRKEEESIQHAQWLKERELRKQEIERAWRPAKPQAVGLKRKNSDSLDSLFESEHGDDQQQQQPQQQSSQEPPKPALSPLLTSLLKSPSQVQNVATSSILHSAITNNQRPISTNTNPMIASLLNSSANVTVSPSLQQLVSSAIGQEQINEPEEQQQAVGTDILDDAALPNLKIDDLANSILVPDDGPLPEIKNEEVDVLISHLIENADDIVEDPEQHLELDGNGDININLELDDLEEEDGEDVGLQDSQKSVEKTQSLPVIDPFEFQEDPEIFEHTKPSTSMKHQFQQQQQMQAHQMQQHQQQQQIQQLQNQINQLQQQQIQHQQQIQQQQLQQMQEQVQQQFQQQFQQQQPNFQQNQQGQFQPFQQLQSDLSDPAKNAAEALEQELNQDFGISSAFVKDELKRESVEKHFRKDKENIPGSVEIVEVVVMEDEEIDKHINKSQIQDIVHSCKNEGKQQLDLKFPQIKDENVSSDEALDNHVMVKLDVSQQHLANAEVKNEHESHKAIPSKDSVESDTTTHGSNTDLSEELYDDVNMEIKIDKSGKAKRDYSRNKKKDEKDFDLLLALEKTQNMEGDLSDLNFSDKEYPDGDVKDVKAKLKSETERSSSPWTEEEDSTVNRSRRRYSTPATPIDSVPDSPASSGACYEDDKEYKNWKKAVMLMYNRLITHKYSSLFLKPITDDQAPGYHSIVYRPTDLSTIRKNIENGTIRTTQEFQRDIYLMFTNAIMYNKTNGTIYNMARQMQTESLEQLRVLLEVATQDDGPLRRETRTSEPGSKRKRGPEESGRHKKRKED